MFKSKLKYSIQRLKNLFWHLPKSIYYNFSYSYPSRHLTLIAVTGTDGKTTTTNLIHQCLLNSGIKAGLISTIGAKIIDREVTIGLHTTSPDSSVVQRLLRQMVNEGVTHVVVEVTAHALDQYRYYGCHFKIAVLTNISHEHLDDFLDLNHYVLTKTKLFKTSDIAILNKDDPFYYAVKKHVNIPIKTYSIDQKSDYQAKNVKLSEDNLAFSLDHQKIVTNSLYRYQVYNILAAYIVLSELSLSPQVLLELIKNFPEIKGRREVVPNDYKIKTIVDFAHTPAALKSTLESLRQTTSGKLIVIFGATGGRDPSKRPIMGKIVSELADTAIITADDTRHEKVENINQQIINGIPQKNISPDRFTYYNIPNRQDAFNLAIRLANSGDTVVACGKGHETTILHGNTEYPWSESEAFRTAFRLKYA